MVIVEYAYMKNSNELHGTSFEYMGELWCHNVGLRIGSEIFRMDEDVFMVFMSIDESEIEVMVFENFEI